MKGRKRERIDWAAAACVFVPVVRPTCPACWSDRYRHVRGERNGDDSSTERVVCAECDEPFKIVREPTLPGSGNRDF